MIGFLLQILSELILVYVITKIALWLSEADNRARCLVWAGFSLGAGDSDSSGSDGSSSGSESCGGSDSGGSCGGGDSGGGGGGD